MAIQIQLRSGTTTEHNTFTGAVGEVTVDTTKDTLVVHDGVTVGGTPLARVSEVTNLVEPATETVQGKVELATQAEVNNGVDTTRVVTPAKLKGYMNNSALGINQTRQNVKSQRTSNTTYTNTSSQPIQLEVTVSIESYQTATQIINGTVTATAYCDVGSGGSIFTTFYPIIPSGHTYAINAGNIISWWELR